MYEEDSEGIINFVVYSAQEGCRSLSFEKLESDGKDDSTCSHV